MSTHFVARIVVEKVEKAQQQRVGSSPPREDREVTEIATILVKDGDLDKLKDKVKAHVSIVDDFA